MGEMNLNMEMGKTQNKNWQVLVVDDDAVVHKMTNMVLKRLTFDGKGLDLINANSAKEAKEVFSTQPNIALALIDVVMETADAGLKLVEYIRNDLKNNDIRLIIRTGQPGKNSKSQVLLSYDINDYCLKTELTSDQLNSVVYLALRDYKTICDYKLREVELEQELDQLKLKNDMRAQMVKNLSHEIKSPLNSIYSATQLMKAFDLDAKIDELVQIIEKSTEGLIPLVDDVLDYARLENGRMIIKKQSFDLQAELTLLVNSYILQNCEERLNIGLTYDQKIPERLLGDFSKLKQVLVNLMNNAIKFTEQGHVTLKVSVIDLTEETCRINFEIIDSGVGIPEDMIQLIFNPFVQYNRGQSEGTGLGLAISRNIANLLGGHLKVESVINEGSRFFFDVAFELPSQGDLNIHDVLLLDDDPIALRSMERVLEKFAESVTCVDTIEKVKDITLNREFQLILLDLKIADDQSLGLIEALAKTEAKVVVISGYSDQETVSKCISLGADKYLVKPFNIEALKSLFKK